MSNGRLSTSENYSWIAYQLEVGTSLITFAVEVRFQIRYAPDLDSSAQTTRVNVLDFFVKPKNGLV